MYALTSLMNDVPSVILYGDSSLHGYSHHTPCPLYYDGACHAELLLFFLYRYVSFHFLSCCCKALSKLCTKEGTPRQATTASVRALSALASPSTMVTTASITTKTSTPKTAVCDMAEAAQFAALDALREAASAKCLDTSKPGRAATCVVALSAFAQELPREFQRYEAKAMAFAKARMAGTGAVKEDEGGEAPIAGDKGKGKGKKRGRKAGGVSGSRGKVEDELSDTCRTLSASIELACNCLMPPLIAGSARAAVWRGGDADGEMRLLDTVFTLLEAEGQPGGEAEMGREERAQLRLVGSTCVVRLCMFSGRVRVSTVQCGAVCSFEADGLHRQEVLLLCRRNVTRWREIKGAGRWSPVLSLPLSFIPAAKF